MADADLGVVDNKITVYGYKSCVVYSNWCIRLAVGRTLSYTLSHISGSVVHDSLLTDYNLNPDLYKVVGDSGYTAYLHGLV